MNDIEMIDAILLPLSELLDSCTRALRSARPGLPPDLQWHADCVVASSEHLRDAILDYWASVPDDQPPDHEIPDIPDDATF